MDTCDAITYKNTRCKNKTNYGNYCSCHKNKKFLPFYPILENWPVPKIIITNVINCVNFKHVEHTIRRLYYINLQSLRNPVNLEQAVYDTRLCFVSVIELLKNNKKLVYGIPEFDKMFNIIIEKFEGIHAFDDYITDFKKKCVKSYRDQARKKVYLFYFKNVEGLCYDVVEKIINMV
jgi:hypothetical protein